MSRDDRDDIDDIAGRELRTLRLAQNMSGGATIVVDPDLAIVSASGPDLVGAGFDPQALTGQRLDVVLAEQQSPIVLEAYRSALRGQGARVEFVGETSGRLFDVEVRPLRGPDGEVVGAVARAADLSDARAQQIHLAHVAAVQGLGVSTYDLVSGWVHDQRTLELLGTDQVGLEPRAFVGDVVVPEDRAEVRARWAELAALGGRVVTSYRVGRGSATGVRRIQTTVEVDLGSGGRLLRVVATHVDVSAAAEAAEATAAVERAERRAQADRVALVRDLSAVVSRSPLTVGEIVKTVTDLAVAVLGGGAFFGGLSADGARFERVATSHADPDGAARLLARWGDPLTRPTPADRTLRPVLTSGEPLTVRVPAVDVEPGAGHDDPDSLAEHLVVVPVRAHGTAVGVLGLQRPDTRELGGPYQPGDVDLAQIMADHIGAAMLAEHALRGERLEHARLEAASVLLDDARSQRHSLVELLSETESRERMLLAEAVHDEPIQLIAAARLRLMALARRLAQEDGPGDGGWGQTVADETGRVGAILETAMDRLRMLIVALTPPDLVDGLLHAIGEVAETTFRGTGTVVRCTGPTALALTPAQQDAAMRILREALVNARHHAHARRVVVRAVVDESHTVLSVEDDGVGSSQLGPRKGHLGMVSMRARADDVGALLTVTSTPGDGTSVVVRFPLPR